MTAAVVVTNVVTFGEQVVVWVFLNTTLVRILKSDEHTAARGAPPAAPLRGCQHNC